MQIKRAVTWLPIDAMPEDRKDGRQMLLWENGSAVIARWDTDIKGVAFWSTGYADRYDDEIGVYEATHWADCDGPEIP